ARAVGKSKSPLAKIDGARAAVKEFHKAVLVSRARTSASAVNLTDDHSADGIGGTIALAPIEQDAAGVTAPAVHGDFVNRTGRGVEIDSALDVRAGDNVIVARDWRQRVHRSAGVDSKQGVEITADGANRDVAACGRDPLIPD